MSRAAQLAVVLMINAAPLLAWSGAPPPPPWMRQAAAEKLPVYPDGTPGVALLDETVTTVSDNGEVRTLYRCVYRILTSAGKDLGYVNLYFDKETTISGFTAWSMTAAGQEYGVTERDAVESARFESELYRDAHMKVVHIPGAQPGSVVAFEYQQSRRPAGLQDMWTFQSSVPVLTARYTLQLADGWSHEEHWFNSKARPAQVSGNSTTWQVTDVAAIRSEPGMPAWRSLAGRMAINFIPRQGQLQEKNHRSWNDVGRWYAQLASTRRAATPDVAAKAHSLADGKTLPLEKIRAIGTFAQRDVRYVAIEIGIGGYQPHPAQQIFANRYGDCKDKVTVLSSMLGSIGVDSYYVLVNTTRGIVDRDFASAGEFNHVIAAIKLPPGVPAKDLYSVIDHPKLGKLLIFDPTNSTTPLGHLPPYLQESEGLLVTDDGGDLIELKPHPVEASRLAYSAKLTLDPAGVLDGDVREVRSGGAAAMWRDRLESMNENEKKTYMDRRLAQRFSSYTMKDFVVENAEDLGADLVVRYHVTAPGYAKKAGGMLLVRPRVVGDGVPAIDLKERHYAYELEEPGLETEEIEIAVPTGLVADEIPPPQRGSAAGVSFLSESSFADGVLHYKSERRVQRQVVPRESLEELSKLFAAMRADERNSVVMK